MSSDCIDPLQGLAFFFGVNLEDGHPVGSHRMSLTHWSPLMAALVVALVALPLACVKGFKTLMKLNSFGVFFLLYVIVFIITESAHATAPTIAEPVVAGGFTRFAGILFGSFFIHHGMTWAIQLFH